MIKKTITLCGFKQKEDSYFKDQLKLSCTFVIFFKPYSNNQAIKYVYIAVVLILEGC